MTPAPKITRGDLLDHVSFDGMTWPLPTLNLLDSLVDRQDPTSMAALSVLRAYHQMVFDPQHKRQRVIRALRAIRAEGESV